MTGGGGFMHDANRKMAQNRALLDKKSVFSERHYSLPKEKRIHKYKKATKEHLKEIRALLLLNNAANKRRLYLIGALSVIIGLLVAWILLAWIMIW